MKHLRWLLVVVVAFAAGIFVAQEMTLPDTPECQPESLTRETDRLLEVLPLDFDDASQESRDNLFSLGISYLNLATTCGYQPTPDERQFIIEQTLEIATLQEIITAQSIGRDVDAALEEIAALNGDSYNGQLLYNGLQPGLDGTELGCAGCHTGAKAGPATEGTYTRVVEVRLEDEALADYTPQQYLVESILHPNAYIIDGWAQAMPLNYSTRLDAQQLADLLTFLESQDQLLPETTPEPMD